MALFMFMLLLFFVCGLFELMQIWAGLLLFVYIQLSGECWNPINRCNTATSLGRSQDRIQRHICVRGICFASRNHNSVLSQPSNTISVDKYKLI